MKTSPATVLIPKKWQDLFDLEDLEEKEDEYVVKLVEKEHLIPKELNGKISVLNGYLDRVEIIDYPLRGKLTYLQFKRRRWKEEGKDESFHNSYTFHRKGMKTTDEFGDFLKGLDREEFAEFCSAWPGVRDYWEENL